MTDRTPLARSAAFACALIALAFPSAALATPASVNLRIEGHTGTLFDGPITTDGHDVTTEHGGTHECDGTNGPTPEPEEVRSGALDSPRLTATLLLLFAALALVITATGIAGVIAFSVGQRRQEFGIRMALGALPGTVLRMVLKQGMRSVASASLRTWPVRPSNR